MKKLRWRRGFFRLWLVLSPPPIAPRAVQVGDYELVAFDLPAGRAGPRVLGWEVFGPPRRQRLLARGDSKTFEDAKAAAETAFAKL